MSPEKQGGTPVLKLSRVETKFDQKNSYVIDQSHHNFELNFFEKILAYLNEASGSACAESRIVEREAREHSH